jgi:hypothetical protein
VRALSLFLMYILLLSPAELVWSQVIKYRVFILQAFRRQRSFLESLIGRQCGSPRQTEGHSFGDHLISAVLCHQVLQKLPAIVLCSVSLWLV